MSHAAPRTVVIDADPGIDDALAIWLAAKLPELRLAAVSTTYGTTTLDNATRNAREVLRRAGGAGTPVLPGADRPWSRKLVTAPEAHGDSGLGDAELPPASGLLPDPAGLLRALEAAEEHVTLVTAGPLTNLALALAMRPSTVRDRVGRHLALAGAIEARGNVSEAAEFNVWCDPEAAERVLAAKLPTIVVPLDAARRLGLSSGEVSALERSDDPDAAWLGRALRYFVEFHRQAAGLDGCILTGPLPILWLLAPDVFTIVRRQLTISVASDDTRGHTRVDGSGPDVEVAVAVDEARARTLLRERALSWISAGQ